MKILIQIIIFASATSAQALTLQPGECLVINSTKVCAAEQRNSVEAESFTKEGNKHCVCDYGIKPVLNSGDPMKGHWLMLVDTGSGVTSSLKNFGGNKSACLEAVQVNPVCRSGQIRYRRVSY